MTRLCAVHDAINLAQGYPDFPAPPEIKEAARRAIDADVNQYPVTWGAENLSGEAIADKYPPVLRPGKSIPSARSP